MRCLTRHRVRSGRLLRLVLLASFLAASCLWSDDDGRVGTEAIADRAVGLATQGCGHASPTEGTGVLLQPDLVLTAAHVVAGSTSVSATGAADPGGRSQRLTAKAEVVALDVDRDLALLRTDYPLLNGLLDIPAMDNADGGDVVHIAGLEPTPRTAVVVERTVIVADRIRTTGRARRLGYLLSSPTVRGESGAGVFGFDHGSGAHELVGLVFAVSTDDSSRTWAVAASEIEAFLAESSPDGRPAFTCDPDQSVLVPVEP